ncbi:hypothetical protein [Nitratifractor salsuginis]|uniref:Uncharacterized protein n=1 Tax=Nitratifractor salsuginis (strain DSM 16511 / JCM 12458 / E9I37-1) TaxID=749222 RepID=E6WY42_NITSE|nr:hypothetical protein [Nitratifractor salsuginis]ADV46416.1 hypothetical protein Nitsa_1163 [Nitratifractor salsuginis DSM 16511]
MIVRIDTTNIARGREFSLYAKNSNGLPVTVRALKPSTGEVTAIEMQHGTAGGFDVYTGTAPILDGYLIATIGKQKIAKKIGHPLPSFVLGYKDGYTVPYEAYDIHGSVIASGNLTDIGGGYYYTMIPPETLVVKALKKHFLVNKNLLKMEYEITMEGGALNSTFDNAQMDNLTLPDVELKDVTLGDAQLDSTLPNVTIKEL